MWITWCPRRNPGQIWQRYYFWWFLGLFQRKIWHTWTCWERVFNTSIWCFVSNNLIIFIKKKNCITLSLTYLAPGSNRFPLENLATMTNGADTIPIWIGWLETLTGCGEEKNKEWQLLSVERCWVCFIYYIQVTHPHTATFNSSIHMHRHP